MKTKALFAFFALALTTGCCPYYNDLEEYDPDQWTSAYVINMGDPMVDGCGWMIQIGDEYYYPVNLEEKYKVEVLPIMIKYTYDPVEFRCGRGGTRFQSIRIADIKIDAQDVRTLLESDWDRVPMDGFRMDSAYVHGDYLLIHVNFSGGCRTHDFKLWRLPANALDPPPVELMLSHDANKDMCEAWISEWQVFSLKPLRERNKHEIKFLLRGSPEMSAYFGEFTYKY